MLPGHRNILLLFLLLFVVVMFSYEAQAITLNQVDTFDQDVAGWIQGASLGNVTRQPTGGPAGVSDPFLQIVSTGLSGGGSRLVVFNRTQWSGDYLSAGVSSITLSAKNLGSTSLNFRLAFGDTLASKQGGNWYASTTSIDLAPESDWTDVEFPLLGNEFTLSAGNLSFDAVLANINTFRFLHATVASDIGTPIAATIGLDNITATTAPLAGDFNGDGTIDAEDYTVWRDNLGAPDESAIMGNGDGLNGIDAADYTLWKTNFASGGGGSLAATRTPIPEPSTLLLLALASMGLIPHRRAAPKATAGC